MNDLLTWELAGVDDYSIARGLALAMIEALTDEANTLSKCLYKAEDDAQGIINLIKETYERFTVDDTASDFLNDFEAFCEKFRSENQDKIIAALSGGVGNKVME